MELLSPVSRLRLAGLALLVAAVAALASCNRPSDKPPEVQGSKKPVAAEPSKPVALVKLRWLDVSRS